MNQKFYFFLLVVIIAIAGCSNETSENQNVSTGDFYYTCPMHPSVVSNTPGACPVCNMSLIKVKKESKKVGHQGNFVTLDSRQQTLAGIQLDTVKFRTIIPASTILGTVVVDEEKVTIVGSRIKGRIDKLFVQSSGDFLQKGSPIYSIYSELLLSDEKEYLALLEKKKTTPKLSPVLEEMILASKNKLLLWGLSEKQISEIENNKFPDPLMTFYAPETGYVSEVNVKEGMYVEEGNMLLKIVQLNQVWVEAQVYSNEIEKINNSRLFQIFTETSPDEILNGNLVYNNPSLEQGRKIHLLRIRVNNSKNKLLPGMMVYVTPQTTAKSVLSIPKSAILFEKMKMVWVRTNIHTFEQRMVETGIENKQMVEILSGLKENEVVVKSGAYLISSEFILKNGVGQKHQH